MKKKVQKHLPDAISSVPTSPRLSVSVTEQKNNWIRIIGIFFLSFVVCFFFSKYLFTWALNQPKTKKMDFSKMQIKGVQIIQILSQLIPKEQYDYYQTKRQFIDPVLIKEALDKKDTNVLLVDIRSLGEYKSAHIKTAISAPAYTNGQNVYGTLTSKNAIRSAIGAHLSGKKLVVIYGYKPDSDISQDVYENIKQSFSVRVMGISWNDWKNNFYSWLPNAEKQNFNINTYLDGADVIKSPGLPQI